MFAMTGECSLENLPGRLPSSGRVLFASGSPRGSGAAVASAFRCPAPEPTRFHERQASMGEAIARFREMALAIRCRSDAAFVAPDHLYLGPAFTLRNVTSRLIAGKVSAADFASMLRQTARTAPGVKGTPDSAEAVSTNREDMNTHFALYRRPILAEAPSKADFDKQHAVALREAVRWGELLPSIEKRLDSVSDATLAMREMAADAWLSRYSRTKQRYAKALLRWQRDFDALGRFIQEPPAAVSNSASEKQTSTAKQKKRRDRKGIGGPKFKYSDELVREVVAARERAEKQAAKARQRLPAWAPWLWDYCRSRINIAEMFPPAFKGEPWQPRAERFKKAAKARLSRSGN